VAVGAYANLNSKLTGTFAVELIEIKAVVVCIELKGLAGALRAREDLLNIHVVPFAAADEAARGMCDDFYIVVFHSLEDPLGHVLFEPGVDRGDYEVELLKERVREIE